MRRAIPALAAALLTALFTVRDTRAGEPPAESPLTAVALEEDGSAAARTAAEERVQAILIAWGCGTPIHVHTRQAKDLEEVLPLAAPWLIAPEDAAAPDPDSPDAPDLDARIKEADRVCYWLLIQMDGRQEDLPAGAARRVLILMDRGSDEIYYADADKKVKKVARADTQLSRVLAERYGTEFEPRDRTAPPAPPPPTPPAPEEEAPEPEGAGVP